MKKLISILLAVLILCGCTAQTPTPSQTVENSPSPTKTPTPKPTGTPSGFNAHTEFNNGSGNLELDYSIYVPDNYDESIEAYVGEIWAAELDEELRSIVGQPQRLFRSDEVPISKQTPHHIVMNGQKTMRYGSDAPFVQKMSDGKLFLTWSPYLNGNYVVLGAVSESGEVFGEWKHLESPLFDQNGGHAMFFDDAEGRRLMCIHAPEAHLKERAHLFFAEEKEGRLALTGELCGF